MSTQNFYEILNVPSTASFDELKVKYKQLILQYHPDKFHYNESLHNAETIVSSIEINATAKNDAAAADPLAAYNNSKFVEINKAWNTLKDPAQRKLYDAELIATRFQSHSNIFERLNLSDLYVNHVAMDDVDDKEKNTKFYTYDCRCGGQYIVDESVDEEIFHGCSDNEVVVECSECSLVIVLNGCAG